MTHTPAPEGEYEKWVNVAKSEGEEIHFARKGHITNGTFSPHALCDIEAGLRPDPMKYVAANDGINLTTCKDCLRLIEEGK